MDVVIRSSTAEALRRSLHATATALSSLADSLAELSADLRLERAANDHPAGAAYRDDIASGNVWPDDDDDYVTADL